MPRKYEPQHGQIVERTGGAFHIRFYSHEAGYRKRRSVMLCPKDADHPSKDAPAVRALAEAFMLKINNANAVNELQSDHSCPLCGNRCRRTITQKFAKQG